MHDDKEDKLYQDMAKGDRYKSAWENLVKPFFDGKQVELFENYKQCSVSDSDTMKEIIHHSKVLDSLRDEFEHYVNTGKLAKKIIEDKL